MLTYSGNAVSRVVLNPFDTAEAQVQENRPIKRAREHMTIWNEGCLESTWRSAMMLVIAIGVLTTMLGVAFGCMLLELTMRAIRRSLGGTTDNPYQRLVPSVSLKSEDR